MLTSDALSIKFHIILVVVLITIQVFYISIIFYKLLPMFVIQVLFVNIALSLFTCFILAYSKEVDTRNDCMHPRVLSLYTTVISICIVLYDPNGIAVMTQTGPTIYVCCSKCIPNRHAHIYPSTWSLVDNQFYYVFSTYPTYMNNYYYHVYI